MMRVWTYSWVGVLEVHGDGQDGQLVTEKEDGHSQGKGVSSEVTNVGNSPDPPAGGELES